MSTAKDFPLFYFYCISLLVLLDRVSLRGLTGLNSLCDQAGLELTDIHFPLPPELEYHQVAFHSLGISKNPCWELERWLSS